MKKISLMMAFSTLFFTGCSETVVMQVKKDIDRPAVSISKDIQVPRPMIVARLFSPSDLLYFPIRQREKVLYALVKQHNIDIAEIVLDSFIKNFENFAPYRTDSRAETIIKLRVISYGLRDEGIFYGSKRLPHLSLYVEMVNERGDVLWDEAVSVSRKSRVKAVENAEIQKNPNLLKEMWSLAADVASRDIIKDMPADLISE